MGVHRLLGFTTAVPDPGAVAGFDGLLEAVGILPVGGDLGLGQEEDGPGGVMRGGQVEGRGLDERVVAGPGGAGEGGLAAGDDRRHHGAGGGVGRRGLADGRRGNEGEKGQRHDTAPRPAVDSHIWG